MLGLGPDTALYHPERKLEPYIESAIPRLVAIGQLTLFMRICHTEAGSYRSVDLVHDPDYSLETNGNTDMPYGGCCGRKV